VKALQVYRLDENLAPALNYSLTKKVGLIRAHYIRRKNLFKFSRNSWRLETASKRYGKNKKVRKFSQPTNVLSRKMLLKKLWFSFLSNQNIYKQNPTTVGWDLAKQLVTTKQLNCRLKKLQENVYGQYDFVFNEWSDVALRKKVNLSDKDLVTSRARFSVTRSTGKKKLLKLNKFKHSFKKNYTPKLLALYNKSNRGFKQRYLHKYSVVYKISFATLSRKKRRLILYAKKITQIVNLKSQTISKKQQKGKLRSKSLQIYKIKHKTRFLKKNRSYRLHKHVLLQRMQYARIKIIKNKFISHFLKLLRVFKKLRKAQRSSAQNAFLKR
jgi:hypothetical protein